MRSVLYSITSVVMRCLLRIFSTWRIYGLENVPSKGPLILVANHISNLDGPLVGASIPRHIFFIAKHDVVKSLFGNLLRLYGVRAMNEDIRDASVFFWARELLERDSALLFFPEARRNLEGMQKANPGVALIATRTQTPILPIALTGTEKFDPFWRVIMPKGKFTVRIGKPFLLPKVNGPIKRHQLESFGEMVMRRVAYLLPEKYRGAYQLQGLPLVDLCTDIQPETAVNRT
jgi:1-acyl-sn-glycerol-3-phosphate acyltransferase